MKSPRRSWLRSVVAAFAAVALLALAVGGVIRAGVYDIGADDPHWPATHALLAQLRDASIARRAKALHAPQDLDDIARITQGAGNYDAMCTGCHLAPGMAPTELSRGLYPAPPALASTRVDATRAFWTIKHGIKASGMPAWGRSMSDEYIWNMAAFVQHLPTLDADGYRALVARSSGHSHGGGESAMQAHTGTMPGMEHDATHPHAPAPMDDGHASDTGAAHTDPVNAPAATGGHTDPPGTPPHSHVAPVAPAHVDPPGAPPHSHGAPTPATTP